MSDKHHMPDPEKVKQTVANLRRTRIEMEEFGLELAEINARLEHDIHQQRLQRARRALNRLAAESQAIERI